MNDQSNHDQVSFESALRKLAPGSGDLSVEDTFYRAGWNAARKSMIPPQRRGIRGFAAGVACGLVSCVVGMLVWSASEHPEQPQMAEMTDPSADTQTKVVPADSVAPENVDEIATDSGASGLDEIFALLSPAGWFGVESESQQHGPLAIARSGVGANGIDIESLWSVTGVPAGRLAPPAEMILGTEKVEPPTSLRAFPLSPDVFDEWL